MIVRVYLLSLSFEFDSLFFFFLRKKMITMIEQSGRINQDGVFVWAISLRRELKRLKKQSFNYYRADPVGTVLENVQLDESNRMDELIEATQVWLEEEGSDMLRDAARDILQLY